MLRHASQQQSGNPAAVVGRDQSIGSRWGASWPRSREHREPQSPDRCPAYMGCSNQNHVDTQRAQNVCTLAKALAPEDVRPGDFVALLHVTAELPSFLWCTDAWSLPADEPMRIQFVPCGGGVPLKVQSVCLPFVLVKLPIGGRRTLDLRQCRLARLDRAYAKLAWKARKKRGRSRRRVK